MAAVDEQLRENLFSRELLRNVQHPRIGLVIRAIDGLEGQAHGIQLLYHLAAQASFGLLQRTFHQEDHLEVLEHPAHDVQHGNQVFAVAVLRQLHHATHTVWHIPTPHLEAQGKFLGSQGRPHGALRLSVGAHLLPLNLEDLISHAPARVEGLPDHHTAHDALVFHQVDAESSGLGKRLHGDQDNAIGRALAGTQPFGPGEPRLGVHMVEAQPRFAFGQPSV
eukprot:Skav213322  [mRNA]  locus=scaffold1383:398407:408924:- [translate_table: standard]